MRDRILSVWRRCYYRLRNAFYVLRYRTNKALSRPFPADLESPYGSARIARQFYRPKPFHGSAILFRASEVQTKLDHRYAGWPNLVTGGVAIRSVPGNHKSIFADRNVGDLARILDAYLSSAGANI